MPSDVAPAIEEGTGQVTMISPSRPAGNATSPAELNVPVPAAVWPVGTHPAPVIDQVGVCACAGPGDIPIAAVNAIAASAIARLLARTSFLPLSGAAVIAVESRFMSALLFAANSGRSLAAPNPPVGGKAHFARECWNRRRLAG